ncbi:MAG: insulinase family protein [Abditibacteriota bacterium]|nr:insulinase family protein [Abditibacteriota bacterium]
MSEYKISNVDEFTLNNGLKVLIKEMRQAPLVSAQLWFKVGSADEPMGSFGFAHFVEHMIFKSSENYKEGEASKLIRGFGGTENAATSYDYTYFYNLLGTEHIEFACEIMAERFHALFDEKELQTEKGVVLSELAGYENRPTTKLFETLCATAYERSPYSRPVIGYRQDLEAVSRETIYDFYKKYYIPNNATLVLVGDINRETALPYINKYFSPIPKGVLPLRYYSKELPQKGFKKSVVDIEGQVPMGYMAFHIPNLHHKDIDALSVLSCILSEGKSSRMTKHLVQTGKAASVSAFPMNRKQAGLFILGMAATEDTSCDEIYDLLIKEIEDIKNNPVTDEELTQAVNQTKAEIVYETDSVSGVGNALGMADVYGDWRDYNNQISRLEAVTPSDISYVLDKYFRENNTTYVVTGLEEKPVYTEVPEGALDNAQFPSPRQLPLATATPQAYGLGGQKEGGEPHVVGGETGSVSPEVVVDEPKRFTLQNGMTLIVKDNPLTSTVAVEGYVKHGDMYEPIGQSQVSKMVAYMLQAGTKMRDYLQIAKSLDQVGAYIDFDCTAERFSFYGKALSEYLDILLYNLSDCLVNSSFPEDIFEIKKKEALSILLHNRQLPSNVSSNCFYNNVVPQGVPFWSENFDNAITSVRDMAIDNVKDFYSYFSPQDTVLVVVGDARVEKVLELCENYFSSYKTNKTKKIISESVYDIPTDRKTFNIPMESAERSEVNMGYALNMKRQSEDFYKFKVLNNILGASGSLNSRFFEEIRERRGLVYGIYSTLIGSAYNGIWKVVFGTGRKSVDEGVRSVDNIMKDIVNIPVSDEEVRDNKNFILGMFAKSLETNEGQASMLSNAEYNNLGLDYDKKIRDYYMPLSSKDIKECAEKYMHPEKGVLVIAG